MPSKPTPAVPTALSGELGPAGQLARRRAWIATAAVVFAVALAAMAWRGLPGAAEPGRPVHQAVGGQVTFGEPLPGGAMSASTAVDPREALARHLAQMPRDGRGWVLLGMAEMEAGRFEAAAQAFGKGVEVSQKVAADPGVWCDYADALGMAQGGSLKGKPTEAIQRALSLKSDHPKALEMAGSAAYERRDFAVAADHWRRLLPLLPPGSAQQRDVQSAIERASRLASTLLR